MQSISQIEVINQTNDPASLRRCLTAFDLTMLGIGAIIGAGIFVLTGIAAATEAGPAIIFSYVLAGIACVFSALAYAELASSVGGCGGAYSYAYAGIGQFVAWIIGWDLLLEYGMDAATVSIGWAGYVQNMLSTIGIALPKALVTNPFDGGIINLPASFIILCLASLLSIGTQHSSLINRIIVYIKLSVIALFIFIGIFHFNANNWHPFLPFGMQGIVNGAGLIFFAYIGFDSLSTAAEETKNPQRDLPIGIIASLLICTLVYILVAGILTGIKYYTDLNVSSPVAVALLETGHKYAAQVISFGAIAGLTTAILAMFFGLTRVMLAMSRDGLLPNSIAKIHLKSCTPRRLIWSMGIIMALIAGLFPIAKIANLVNIGTLAAFVAVSISVIVLRYVKPSMPRPFKTPFSPLVPVLSVLLSLYLMSSLPYTTWISFTVWTMIGLVIYFFYSRRNSLKKSFI
jgi:APA family basic amino acid/polyamine antiporter